MRVVKIFHGNGRKDIITNPQFETQSSHTPPGNDTTIGAFC